MPDTNRTDIEWLKKSQAEIKAEMKGGFDSLADWKFLASAAPAFNPLMMHHLQVAGGLI